MPEKSCIYEAQRSKVISLLESFGSSSREIKGSFGKFDWNAFSFVDAHGIAVLYCHYMIFVCIVSNIVRNLWPYK